MNPNHNLIFLHLPKNGGNTLHSILERVYPKEQRFSIEVVNQNRLNTDVFKALPERERAQIKLLKGHMFFGLHPYLVGPSKYLTFLRKPEDRVRSFYHYVKQRPEHRLYDRLMEGDGSFLHFIEHIDDKDVHNGQIRWLSGLEHGSEAEMLACAKAHIEDHFSFVGLQEAYDTSLILLSQMYGWGLPYYQHRNKGTYRKPEWTDGPIAEAIRLRNQGDLALYEYVQGQFEQLKKATPFLNLKVKQLRLANTLYGHSKIRGLVKHFKR